MKLYKIVLMSLLLIPSMAQSNEYVIDKKGMHASIQFRVSHLGYSWLWGRFNEFEGRFNYDSKEPEKSTVNVTIKTHSVDSNHAERDKHLRSDDFLDVKKYPEASFVSTSYQPDNNGGGILNGDFTLRGITKPISISVKFTGEGVDPWGGYRAGFEGTTKFLMSDYKIKKDLGPASKEVELFLVVEGIREKVN